MDVGHSNGWRLDEVVPADEIVDDDRRRAAARAGRPGYRGEVAGRWRYRDGGGEIGRHRVGHPAVLRRLHAGPALGRGQALHVPVRRRRPRPAGAPARRRVGRRDLADVVERDLAASAATATPSCGRAATSDAAADRDVRDGRLSGAARSGHGCPQLVHSGRQLVDSRRAPCAEFVDNRVDPPPAPARNVGLARRGRQDRRTRDHIKDLRSAPVASGASLPGRAAVSPRPSAGPRPTGRDRHPGVGTSVGPHEAAGLGRRPPGRVSGGPHVRCIPTRPRRSRPRPIPPAEQPARLDALEAAVRARTDLVPEVGIVLGLRARRPRRRPRGRGRDPVRRAARLARRDRAGPRRPAPARDGSADGRS